MTKKTSLGKNYVRNRYSFITSDKAQRRIEILTLREKFDFPELCSAIDHLKRNLHPRFHDSIWGNPLPKSYSDLGVITEPAYISKELFPEINSVLLIVREHKDKLNLFLNLKNIYEKNLFLGNYDYAEKVLEKIENEVCFSLWSLENRFLLKEFKGNSSESKSFLSDFNKSNNSNFLTKDLASYFSYRAERSLSVGRYLNDLELALSKLPQSNFGEVLSDYYRFKLTFLGHLNFKNYSEIIGLDFEHSLIDRYLNLTRVLTSLLEMA